LSRYLGDLPAKVRGIGLDLDAIKSRERREYVVESNWKVVIENTLECYHCPVAHPSFSDLVAVGEYHVDEFEYYSTQGGPVKESAKQKSNSLYHVGAGVEEGFYAYLWPTFTVNIYPGPGNVSLNLILPEGVNRTRMVYEWCFVDDVSEQDSKEFIAFVNQIQMEDTALCESVQRGIRSGYWERGKLMLSRENGLRHFQQLWQREIATR
jgi:choline monooxygenase